MELAIATLTYIMCQLEHSEVNDIDEKKRAIRLFKVQYARKLIPANFVGPLLMSGDVRRNTHDFGGHSLGAHHTWIKLSVGIFHDPRWGAHLLESGCAYETWSTKLPAVQGAAPGSPEHDR